jgi:hypothetical protein
LYQKYLDSEARFEIALKTVQTKVECSLNLLEELSRLYASVDFTSIKKSVEKEDLFFDLEIRVDTSFEWFFVSTFNKE